MSEAVETPPPAEEDPPKVQHPPELEALIAATLTYAKARAKLPPPGTRFAEKDSGNFKAYTVALLALERAGMAFAGKRVKQ